MQLDYPFRIDGRHTATTSEEEHIRDLIEQVLFTEPGERVNRPTFGAGLRRLIFAGNGDALAAATQLLVQSSLQQWLGELIEVGEIEVRNEESTLRLTIRYRIRRTQKTAVARFTKEV